MTLGMRQRVRQDEGIDYILGGIVRRLERTTNSNSNSNTICNTDGTTSNPGKDGW
jgi:hypothetical protein